MRDGVRIPLGRKLAYSALAIVLGLVALEAVSAALLQLPAFSGGKFVKLGNLNDEQGSHLNLPKGALVGFDALVDNSIKWNAFASAVTEPDPELIFRVRPAGESDRLRRLGVNASGFRGADFDFDSFSGRRVMVIGDSCAYGWEIADYRHTWVHRLEQALAAGSEPTRVYNFGQPGYSTFQCRLLFERWFERVDPDYLIVYAGWNDLNEQAITDEEVRALFRWSMSPWTERLRKLRIYRLLAQAVVRARIDHLVARAETGGKGRRVPVEDSIRHLGSIVDESIAAGCPVIVVVPPFSAARAPGTERGMGFMVDYRDKIAAALKDRALFVSITAMDYRNPGSVDYFIESDSYHPNELGAEYIARALAKVVEGLEADR